VSESWDIQQIEYRWQRATDMTPIATSLSSGSLRSWTERIGPWVRHPEVDGPVKTPTESVRYESLGDTGLAAIAWRQRDPRAALADERHATRPVVSRVLAGSDEVLTPGVAILLCATGLPDDLLGPQPGSVARGAGLPSIHADDLTRVAKSEVDRHDEAAAVAEGLHLVVAAALSNHRTPLSVELPERLITEPVPGGPQAHLLWGLWRTLRPLLGSVFGGRGWSFSTFEPPQGDTDPGALGGIVFRAAQAGSQAPPMTVRQEIFVRPYEPARQPPRTRDEELAELLVAAYRRLGGAELRRVLQECTTPYNQTAQRIDAAYRELAGPPRNGDKRVPPGAGAPQAGGYPSQAAPTVVHPVVGLERGTGPLHSVPVMSRASAVRGPDEETADQRHQAGKLSVLVDNLSHGPEDLRFREAVQALQAEMFESDPGDRADARQRLRANGWYVDVLGGDPRHLEEILFLLCLRTAVPDLPKPGAEPQPGLARELTDWASQPGTPAVVIKALYAAAGERDQQPELTHILASGLGGRWLAEHGISAPPPRQAALASVTDAAPSAPRRDAPQPAAAAAPGNGSPRTAAGRHSTSVKQGPGARGAAPRAAGQAGAAGVAAPPADPAPLLSMQTVIRLLRRRIPVYAALLLAIVVMILVIIA
jgi:hypothetical protein